MVNENTFRYEGQEVTFGGFYKDRFAFDIGGRVVMVKSIEELEEEMTKSLQAKTK